MISFLGRIDWAEPCCLRYPHNVSDKSDADLPSNLRAVQLLLGHTKLENTVRTLGVEVDDALEIAESTEV